MENGECYAAGWCAAYSQLSTLHSRFLQFLDRGESFEGFAEAGSNGEYCGGTELVVNTNRMISQNRGMQ